MFFCEKVTFVGGLFYGRVRYFSLTASYALEFKEHMDKFEFNIDEKLRPSVERKLTGSTKIDSEISALPLYDMGLLVKVSVLLLRFYRKIAPHSLRCRCVFDPSCSHYSELAFRESGFILGVKLTYNRLSRCKPGAGGIDFLYIKNGD